MAKRNEIYKCEVCGNIVEVLNGGAGQLVCCGKQMKLLVGNTTDAAQEKHVPVIEKTGDGFLVKVGSVAHPMLEEHFIEWIELVVDGRVCRAFLKPGEKPEAFFPVKGEQVLAREHCNLHGLWKAEA
ncbi:MAG: desulfoferrodoxin [bacterium]